MNHHFPGFLNLDCLMFTWDQYLISSFSPSVQEKVMAAISASILLLCKKELLTSPKVSHFLFNILLFKSFNSVFSFQESSMRFASSLLIFCACFRPRCQLLGLRHHGVLVLLFIVFCHHISFNFIYHK